MFFDHFVVTYSVQLQHFCVTMWCCQLVICVVNRSLTNEEACLFPMLTKMSTRPVVMSRGARPPYFYIPHLQEWGGVGSKLLVQHGLHPTHGLWVGKVSRYRRGLSRVLIKYDDGPRVARYWEDISDIAMMLDS